METKNVQRNTYMDSIFKHIYGKHFKCLLTNFTIIFILPFWIYFNHSLSEWFKRKRWIINRLQRKLVFIWRNLFKGTGFLCKGQPIFNANSFKHDTSFEQPVIWLRVYIKVPKACYRNMRYHLRMRGLRSNSKFMWYVSLSIYGIKSF